MAEQLIPDAAVPLLIASLHMTKDKARWTNVACALAGCKRRRGFDALISELTNSEASWKRRAVAYALSNSGRSNHHVVVALLVAAKTDTDTKVRAQAIEALASGPKSIAIHLVNFLQDASPRVRFWAAYALSQVGGKKDIPALRVLLEDDSVVRNVEIGLTKSVGEEAQWAIDEITRGSNRGAATFQGPDQGGR